MRKPPPKRLESSADFARRASVSRSAISQALRGKLRAALVDDRIDIDHPAAIAYLGARGKKPPAMPSSKTADAPTRSPKRPVWIPDGPTSDPVSKRGRRRAPTEESSEEVIEAPENIVEELDALAELLRPIVDRFGTARRFKDFLGALETIERIQEKHLGNEETKGNLIDRNLVSNHVFGALRSFTQKMLRDFPKTSARRVFSLAKAGASLEEAEAAIREMLSKQIKDVKGRIDRALKAPT